ncbi:Asp-tRNA(Asn)/Glu-tRNA(Gln) amidotransferase subunit GatA [bacterium]|nr:Asp-tRNA(Asn)/Glu-tRNA(Gln) amidotransferase subunit GatA [bacterium]
MPLLIPSPETLRRNPEKLPEAVAQSLALARANRHLGAFIELLDERAGVSCGEVMARIRKGEELPLAGFIIAVKDNISIKDVPLTCGSRILDHHPATFTATAVERLERAGAIVIGKTNLDEFAMGSSNENSSFGPARHPLDDTRVPGGSSGGSAVSVAAGWCHAALGSDTGGSVRQPAAFCGIVGLKPTYGRVSRYGLVAFGSSLDQISPFAHDCTSAFEVLHAMAGADSHDATSAHVKVPECEVLSLPKNKLRVGVVREFVDHEALAPSIRAASREVCDALTSAGHTLVEVSLPTAKLAIPVYYIVATAEASSNLARFDGARYGKRSADATDVNSVLELSRGIGFGPEVRRRIMMGTYVLSAGYFDAYYRTAQKVRRLIKEELQAVLAQTDVLLTPTTPSTAFRIGEKVDDPVAMYLSDIFTTPANLAGLPAVSIPWRSDESGLPIGMQLMANYFDEELLLSAGMELERLRPGV